MEEEYYNYPEIGATYQHYKGGTYRVITMAKHTETGENLVVYVSIEHGSHHARPLEVWNGVVKKFRHKNNIPRFSKI